MNETLIICSFLTISIYKLQSKRYNYLEITDKRCIILKKAISLLLVLVLAFSAMLVACSKSTDEKETGIEGSQDEYGIDYVEVTDDKGKTVTDKNGDVVTTEISYKIVKDKNGKEKKVVVDSKGKEVTDKKGKEVTLKPDKTSKTTTEKESAPTPTKKKKTTTSTTVATTKGEQTTEKELTTIKPKKDKVPSTSATGEVVVFSSEDQQIIKNMLEVPYLYQSSYENAQGVPMDIATHAAIWMAERDGLNTSNLPSGTIVLNLFKYFGQTVVNFKSKCNEAGNENIEYKSSSDTFHISAYENSTHNVKISKIEYLGNNNYYKVTATVSGTSNATKVVAVVQKNKLDSTLGFSIKALKWS